MRKSLGVRAGIGLVCVSGLFQNCGPAFQKIDLQEKNELIQTKSVFGGNSYYVYLKTRKLKSLEEGAGFAGQNGGDGEIPATGPNGEVVIPVEEPLTLLPGAGNLPASGSGQGEVGLQNGVMVGPNWYVPPTTTTVTTTTSSNNSNSNSAAILGILGGIFGAIGAFNTTSSSTPVTNETYSSSSPDVVPPNSSENIQEGGSNGFNLCTNAQAAYYEKHPNETRICSPLLIAFDDGMDGQKTFSLTNPFTDGRFFDIAGTRSWPQAHTKKRISWLTNANSMFAVLPDANGEVHGIDQLFGDSTLGPDGNYSKNGYVALGKWDGMQLDGKTRINDADGYISSNDPIFEKLKLWSDRNFDAIAQTEELLSLEAMHIEVLDLHYDKTYVEMDSFGNFTTYKSVARDSQGKLHLMFDLWFNVHD